MMFWLLLVKKDVCVCLGLGKKGYLGRLGGGMGEVLIVLGGWGRGLYLEGIRGLSSSGYMVLYIGMSGIGME